MPKCFKEIEDQCEQIWDNITPILKYSSFLIISIKFYYSHAYFCLLCLSCFFITTIKTKKNFFFNFLSVLTSSSQSHSFLWLNLVGKTFERKGSGGFNKKGKQKVFSCFCFFFHTFEIAKKVN